MRTARLALVAAGLASVGFAVPSLAATTTTPPAAKAKELAYTDPAGDGKMEPGDDIVGVRLTTAGTTATVGKKTTYTPKQMVLSLTTASPVATNGTVQYTFEGNVPGCGAFYVAIAPGELAKALPDPAGFPELFGSCPDDKAFDFTTSAAFKVDGSTLTVTFDLNADFKAGATISDVLAYSAVVEPVTGEIGPTIQGGRPLSPFSEQSFANDDAVSTATYTIG